MRPTALALSAVVLALSSRAGADSASRCSAAFDEGQASERRGKLVEAGKQFLSCAGLSCPAAVRAECAKRLEAVSRATPSVTVVVRDTSGDTRDVPIEIDGRTVDARSGRAVPLDPGEHIASFGFDGKRWTQKFLAQEGERSRVVVLTPDTAVLASKSSRDVTAPPSPFVEPPKAETPSKAETPHSVGPWVLGGAGLAATLVSVIFYVDYKSTDSRLRTQFAGACTADNDPACSPAETALQTTLADQYTANQARTRTKAIPILAVLGIAAMAGAIVWRVLESSGH